MRRPGMKTLSRIGIVIALPLLVYAGFWWHNNRPAQSPSVAAIADYRERGVQWLLQHRDAVLRDGNTMLWWMVGESARVSGDARLQQLYDEFRRIDALYHPNNIWDAFFEPQRFRGVHFERTSYRQFADYQQFFLYGLTCSDGLLQDPLIAAQNDTAFCRHGGHAIRPACLTHQLMGFRLAQRNGCALPDLQDNIQAVQASIATQLAFDPRVVDVYVQRVLMLEDSGAAARVKPRWIERALAAQRPDGGWSDMQPLLPVGGGRYFGFGSKLFTIAVPRSNFHATAQGVWLTTLLLARPRE